MDTDIILDPNALEGAGSQELFVLLDDLDIPQEHDIICAGERCAESEKSQSDFLEFFNNIDIETIIPKGNFSNFEAGGAVSANREPTPCQTCAAKGKAFMKKLVFISYDEALYMCENLECENDSTDIEPIRINFWEKPLTVKEIENLNLPGELLKHLPVITYGVAKKILYIAKYRTALQNYALAEEAFHQSYRIQTELFGKRDAVLVDMGTPPCKSDFCLAEISDSEVQSIIDILDSIDKTLFTNRTIDKIVSQKKEKKSSSHIPSESINVEVENPPSKESKKVNSNLKSDKKNRSLTKRVIYDPQTGKAVKEVKGRMSANRNAKKMLDDWSNMLPKLGIHKS